MSSAANSKSSQGKLYRKIIPAKDENGISNEKETEDKDKQEEETEDEAKKKKNDPPPVPFHKLFQFATGGEKLLIVTGCIMSIISALGMPILVILFGNVTNAFVYNAMELAFASQKNASNGSYSENGNFSAIDNNSTFNVSQENLTESLLSSSPSPTDQYTVQLPPGLQLNFLEEVQNFGVYTCILGIVQLIASYFMIVCLNTAADRQIFRIRVLFLKSVLRQEIAWYDDQPIGEFTSRSIADLNKLQDGIGEKLGMFIFFMTNFVVDMIIAFVYGWKLTLVILSAMPLLTIATAAFMKIQSTMANDELKAYSKAGSVAEEVFQSVKTVFAFNGEEKETDRFEKNLIFAQKAAIKRGLVTGLGTGVTWLITYGSFSLAFWYGVKLFFDSHRDHSYEYDASTIIIVFFSALMGAMMIGQGSPFMEAINVARVGAATVFKVIHRVPIIDSSSIQGDRPPLLIGDIHFKDVHFNYPSRSDVNILTGLDFKIASGQTVALVGRSGCGKSTLIQLVQRMYDVNEGSVKIDGKDVRRFNVRWLRERIGVVGQEPVLFGLTISENIRLGCEGVTLEQIEQASKAANAHDFIMKLPKRYDTLVGDRGSQLSGGQKQRIAIARALVKNPRILLLDEATSALDSESEGIVQAALDKARKGRTTLIVAHRLTTVRNADVICVINDGQVAEHGTHDDLMNLRGVYYELVQTQQQGGEQDEDETEEVIDGNEKGDRKMSYHRRPTVSSITSGSLMGRSMSLDQQVLDEEEEDEEKLKPSVFRIVQLNSPEWPYILLGCFGAIGFGCTTPVYALLFGDIMGVLSITVEAEARKESEFYAILFVVLGLWAGISCFLQMYMFAVAGDKLTARIRKLTFSSILKQECGWFDLPKNSTGALCTRLAVDAANVQGATGSRIGILLQSFSTVIIALVFALVLVWKQALVTAVFMPLVLVATYYQGKFMMGQNDKEIKSQESCGKIASEAINNIRTVASLSREDKFREMYAEGLIKSRLNYWKVVQVRGVIFGLSQSLPCVSYAASMWYGGYLIEKEGVAYEDVFKIAELLIFGMMMIGQSVAMAPNYNKGLMSAGRIFKLLDRKPLIEKCSNGGLKLGDLSNASVEFEGIKFSYPTRTQAQILKGLHLKVENGITLALVGHSGCGKSTCVQLLERFYDPLEGTVRLGGHNINDLNLSWLRDQMGLVSQEPVLFDSSIMDNIAYGCNTRKVHMDEIIQAAKQANIHNFISALPQGYNTSVGSKGTQLSGGQKQRIAIARALIRNPKILLLDEATSALDSESEKLVQEALDKAAKNRTTIIIAHRLSTIQNADCIVCIHQGQVAEYGTHQELLDKKGYYFKLYSKSYNK